MGGQTYLTEMDPSFSRQLELLKFSKNNSDVWCFQQEF